MLTNTHLIGRITGLACSPVYLSVPYGLLLENEKAWKYQHRREKGTVMLKTLKNPEREKPEMYSIHLSAQYKRTV